MVPVEEDVRSLYETDAELVRPMSVTTGKLQLTKEWLVFVPVALADAPPEVRHTAYTDNYTAYARIHPVDTTLYFTIHDYKHTALQYHYIRSSVAAPQGPHHSHPISGQKKWNVSHLRAMYRRRYLLRSSALELFFVDTSSVFFNFAGKTKARDTVARKIVQLVRLR